MSDFGLALLETFRARALVEAQGLASLAAVTEGTPAGDAIIEFGRTLEPWLSRYTVAPRT